MALDTKDYVWGSIATAIALGSALYCYGTQFDHTTETRNTTIAGESVEIQNYENKIWGGGQYIQVDGKTYTTDAYKERLEELVDKALVEKQE